jgi:limonene-1,2-epoxide hydrolase
MLVWCIWQNRNDMVWNNHTLDAYQLGHRAFIMWRDWFDAQQSKQPSSNNNTLQHNSRWQKPTQGWIKCNIDAGFFMEDGITSLACCFRNATGEFFKAQTKWINTKLSTIEGEGMAFIEAIAFSMHNGWDRIIFESDSQILVDSIHANQVVVSEFSNIINSIELVYLVLTTLR